MSKIDVTQIASTVVGVKLSVRGWGGSSKANEAARELESTKGAEIGACGVEVYYLPEEVSAGLGQRRSALRTWFTRRSLPFEDGGWRICKAESFMELTEGLSPLKSDYEDFAEKHVVEQRDKLEVIARKRLGSMFNEFPSESDLRGRFVADFDSKSITLNGRIEGLTEEAANMVAESERRRLQEGLTGAVESILNTLAWLVEDMAGRIGKETQKRTRYGGLIETVRGVCQPLRALNITNDPAIANLIVETERRLTAFTADSLRGGGWAGRAMEAHCDKLRAELLAVRKAVAS